MRRAWGWLVGAACYAPHARPGAPCDDAAGQPCPSGQQCVARICTVSACDAAPPDDSSADGLGGDAPVNLDSDGDGVVDTDDNCPTTPNPGQDNEDHDAFGDACDPCPPIADDHPPDTDHEGVADACDPHPTTAGDAIALFEGFAHGVPTTPWTAIGAWATMGDNLVGDATSTPSALQLFHADLADRETLTAKLIVLDPGGTGGAFGVLDDHDASHQTTCVGEPGAPQVLATFDQQTGATTTAAFQATAGSVVTLVLTRDRDVFTCRAISLGQDVALTLGEPNHAPAASLGLGLQTMAASFAWVMVVTSTGVQ